MAANRCCTKLLIFIFVYLPYNFWGHILTRFARICFFYLACTELYFTFGAPCFYACPFFLSVFILSPMCNTLAYLTFHESAVRLTLLHVNVLLMYLASK